MTSHFNKYAPIHKRIIDVQDGSVMPNVYELAIQKKPNNFADSTLHRIINYVYKVISIVWLTILIVYKLLATDVDELKKSVEQVKNQLADAKLRSQKTAQQNVKCSRCHACGHQESECSTENPAAVRWRVANNNKAKAQQWSTLASSVPPLTSFPAPTHYADPFMNPYFANAVSDAHELHRHKQQSNRDWRKAKT